MSWDWKKAIGADDTAAGSILTKSFGANLPAAKRVAPPSSGQGRSPIISWRSAGVTNLTGFGSSVALEDQAEHDCPFCHGCGKFAGASICPVCAGSGKIRVEPPAVRCAFCGGHGQMPPRSHMTCWVCGGRGLVSVRPPVQTCPDCQGRGRRPCQSLYCPRCRGVGVITLR